MLAVTVGKYLYRIERRGTESEYTVTDGVNTVTLPIRWAMGASSALGQTYILEKDGQLYESRRAAGEPLTQSERDWSYAIRKLQAGEDPQKIIRDMGNYRSQERSDRNGNVIPAKARPYYYAEHTVQKAMAHLGIKPPEKPAAREADVQPHR